MSNWKYGLTVGGITFGMVLLILGVEWLIICGVIKLITLCFGWVFKWKIATGIWLGILILRTIFKDAN